VIKWGDGKADQGPLYARAAFMKAQRRQAEYDRLAALVQSRAPKSPGEKFVAGASYRFNENPPQATGNADFIGIGGALTHIRFMPGCPPA
jgi:hypothetical protein